MYNKNEFITRLNKIRWRTRDRITPKAAKLIDEHIEKAREVIRYLAETKGMQPVEAYGYAQTAGHDTRPYDEIVGLLAEQVSFKGAGVREGLIVTLSACYAWELDQELAHLPNPWLPVLHLCEMGYPVSGEDSPEGDSITLTVGLRQGIKSYTIV